MKQIMVAGGALKASAIALGCMRMSALEPAKAKEVLAAAFDAGINFIDHADIYGGGASEEVFAEAIDWTPSKRQSLILQSKCGIQKLGDGFYDFSKEHILEAVEGSLKRLKTDYLDVLLLHRPDALMEPEEVAEAFTSLREAGKVRYFGVSNEKPMQIELLKKYLKDEIFFNQLQFSVMHTGMIDSGMDVNMKIDGAIDRDGSVLDYCRLNNITIQAWSPFQYGYFDGVFLDNDKFPKVNAKINEIASRYGVSNSAIAAAWILRHPANMQVILGSMNPERIGQICKGADIKLTRQEWYEIYLAAGNILP